MPVSTQSNLIDIVMSFENIFLTIESYGWNLLYTKFYKQFMYKTKKVEPKAGYKGQNVLLVSSFGPKYQRQKI